jgi:hypothetical protein
LQEKQEKAKILLQEEKNKQKEFTNTTIEKLKDQHEKRLE